MKIEWLNDDKTLARITKGWLWKKFADVRLTNGMWRYTVNNAQLELWDHIHLDQARWKRPVNPWSRVVKLPKATIISE